MTTFDSAFVSACIACIVCWVSLWANGRNKKLIHLIVSIVLTLALVFIAVLSYCHSWPSDILFNHKENVNYSDQSALSAPANIDVGSKQQIIGTASMLSPSNDGSLPSMYEPEKYIYENQQYLELTWPQFSDYSDYQVYFYENDRNSCNLLREIDVKGQSYSLDLSELEHGKTYQVNISVDETYFSEPIIISMLE